MKVSLQAFFFVLGALLIFETHSTHVVGFGDNSYGQVVADANLSRPVTLNTDFATVVEFGTGIYGQHVLALSQNRSLVGWGRNTLGQAGFESAPTISVTTPRMTTFTSRVYKAITGYECSMVILDDGSLYTWGLAASGQLGHGGDLSVPVTTPKQVETLMGKRVISGCMGLNFSVAVTDDGSVYSWGQNDVGQLGDFNTTNMPYPALVFSDSIVDVKCGTAHVVALKSDGVVITWGKNTNGQLGTGNTSTISVRYYIPAWAGAVKLIGANDASSYALTTGDAFYVWGAGAGGVLGQGDEVDKTSPTLLTVGLKPVRSFTTGIRHVIATTTDGLVYGWGVNEFYETGLSPLGVNILEPQILPIQSNISFSAMYRTSFAILEDCQDDVDCRGYGDSAAKCSGISPNRTCVCSNSWHGANCQTQVCQRPYYSEPSEFSLVFDTTYLTLRAKTFNGTSCVITSANPLWGYIQSECAPTIITYQSNFTDAGNVGDPCPKFITCKWPLNVLSSCLNVTRVVTATEIQYKIPMHIISTTNVMHLGVPTGETFSLSAYYPVTVTSPKVVTARVTVNNVVSPIYTSFDYLGSAYDPTSTTFTTYVKATTNWPFAETGALQIENVPAGVAIGAVSTTSSAGSGTCVDYDKCIRTHEIRVVGDMCQLRGSYNFSVALTCRNPPCTYIPRAYFELIVDPSGCSIVVVNDVTATMVIQDATTFYLWDTILTIHSRLTSTFPLKQSTMTKFSLCKETGTDCQPGTELILVENSVVNTYWGGVLGTSLTISNSSVYAVSFRLDKPTFSQLAIATGVVDLRAYATFSDFTLLATENKDVEVVNGKDSATATLHVRIGLPFSGASSLFPKDRKSVV